MNRRDFTSANYAILTAFAVPRLFEQCSEITSVGFRRIFSPKGSANLRVNIAIMLAFVDFFGHYRTFHVLISCQKSAQARIYHSELF